MLAATESSRTDRARRRRRALTGLALVALLGGTLAAYRPALDAGFIGYDDTAYVHKNAHVSHGLRLADVRWAMTGYEQSNWHPLTWISHMLDVELFGFSPRGPHAVNVALHALNALLLFLVLRSLTGAAAPSLLVAALFALHPANVESVAWIAQRKTLLCTLFMLLAIAAYASYARGGGRRAYLATLGLFVLAMTAKPMIVTFPFGLLLLDYWPLRRKEFAERADGAVSLASLVRGALRLLPEKLPFLALAALHALVTLDAQRDAMSSLDNLPVGERLGNVTVSYVGYLATYFAPVRLAVFYPLYPENLTHRMVLGSAALLAALTVAFVALGLRRRHLLVGWLWFVGTLVPVIGIVQVGMQSMADRYVYVPFWGLSMGIAFTLDAVLRTRALARAAAATAAVATIACLGVLTYRQSENWHDAFRLFSSAIENTEGNYLAHSVLAERYYADAEYEKCVEQSREAVKHRRNMGPVRSTYGLALYALGERDLALEQFTLAAEQEFDNPIGFMNLGWFEAERGRYDLALRHLDAAAVRIKHETLPYTKKMIYANWGNALAKTGQLEDARKKYEMALDVEPEDLDILRAAAGVDLQLGDPPRAIARLERVLELAPGDAGGAYLRASAVALAGGESAPLFAAAQKLAPRQAVVTMELARTLARAGRFAEADRLLEALLSLDPPAEAADAQFVASTAHGQRGEIRLERGDVAGGMAELDRALAIWPENFDAGNRLAFLLATAADPALRDPARAVALAERAAAQRREYAALATLAAAYASAGRLPAAIATAREGLDLAKAASDEGAVAALEHQLAVFARMQGVSGES